MDEEIRQIIDDMPAIQESIAEIEQAINGIVEDFENIAQQLQNLKDKTVTMDSSLQSATGIVDRIRGNAKRSNILALNASIESAISGEAGRGFAVVATEMGKLSNDSDNSTKEIDKALVGISQQLKSMETSINDMNHSTSDYIETVQNVKEVLSKTVQITEKLQNN